MAGGEVKVQGARQLRRTLRRAGVDMTEVKNLHGQVGSIVTGAARPTTPRRTGRLSGTVRFGATNTGTVIRAGYKRVPYAGPIHFGWPRRNIRPQPWVTKAAQATEPRWFAVFTAGIERILDKIKGA